MERAIALIALLAAVIGLSAVRQPKHAPVAAEQFVTKGHAVAALAWAKSKCENGLERDSAAPREHAEVIYRVAAAYDAMAAQHSRMIACHAAITEARPVIANR